MESTLLAILLSLSVPHPVGTSSTVSQATPQVESILKSQSQQKAAKTDFADPATTTYEYVRPQETVVKPASQNPTLNQSRAPPAFGATMPDDLGFKNGRPLRSDEVEVSYGPARNKSTSKPITSPTFGSAGPQAPQAQINSVIKEIGRTEVQIPEAVKRSIIQEAQSFQGSEKYPGIDKYEIIVVKKGTALYGGEPFQSQYYTTERTLKEYGNDANRIFQALQVKDYKGSYRPGLTEYILKEDTIAAVGITRANPQYGPGGGVQLFIKNFDDVLKPTKTYLLKNLLKNE